MHLRCKNNILYTYLLHSKYLHKKYDNGKRNRKNIQNRQKQHKKYDNGKRNRKKKYTGSIMNESKR